MAVPLSVPEPIAVVGSSCRFPGGASTPSKLWQLLKEPRDLLGEVPKSRFNAKGFYHPDGEHHGSTNVTQSYFLDEDVRVFDYNFFNINPREAESMDPQQRLLLETVYEGMESAGYSLQNLKGSDTCVFVGQTADDYTTVLNRDIDTVPNYFATGVSRAVMANRVSFFFDWKGSSVCIDTACSSSLVAVHQAIQELRNGSSKMAVAAGVNVILGPEVYIFESKLHMLSPTGRSRMWDADADGYARGEGFAAVFLKTLRQALADGDHIECVIRETGINQDGRTPGITMPSPTSQAALIRATYARAGLDLSRKEDRCQYFEAHGTGTLAGDPVEAEAVYSAFFGGEQQNSKDASDVDPLYVGSIKTVFGHLESSAGLAGLLKASLAVQHGVIPPNMHFNRLNPKIEPFYRRLCVPTKAHAWPELPEGAPRRVSLNSFGFGGTNAHAIIESWSPNASPLQDGAVEEKQAIASEVVPYGPFTFSAHSKSALLASAAALLDHVKEDSNSDLASLSDLAWTLQMRRTEFPYRAYVSGTNREELVQSLEASIAAANKEASGSNAFATQALPVSESLPPRILGIFTGQGAQWPAMGAGLYAHSALFRQTMHGLEDSLAQLPESDRPSWSLTAELLKPAATSRIQEAALSQPLCTALQIALVDLLRASGIEFSGVVGHSSGEIAAAYTVGYLSAADAVCIAYYRGVHAGKARDGPKPGKMMAVGMSYDEALAFCQRPAFAGRIVAAASNSRSSTTLSGDADAIDEAKQQLDTDGVFARELKVDTAYHSHHMQPCSGPYLESLRQCNIDVLAPPVAPDRGFTWFSSVHGHEGRSIYEPETYKDTYWVDNMAQPVLFSQALDRAITESYCYDMVLEVGPHPALKGPASEVLRILTSVDLPYTGVLSRGANDVNAFSNALGFIWSHFQSTHKIVDFEGFRKACLGQQHQTPRLLKGLPPYSWDHDVPLWKESILSKKFRTREEPVHELLGSVSTTGNNQEMRWRNIMKINELEWLRGHQFQNQVLFPAAGYVSMAVEAAVKLAEKNINKDGEDSESVQIVELQSLQIHTAITIDPDSVGTEVIFVIRVISQTSHRITAEFSCYSGSVDGTTNDAEKVNFTGQAVILLGSQLDPAVLPPRVPPTLPMAEVDLDRFYREFEKIGLNYSGDFVMESAQRRLDLATAIIKRPAHNASLIVHPATLDAAFHGLLAAFCFAGDGRMWTSYLPTGIRTVRVNVAAAKLKLDNVDENTHVVADCFLREATSKVISGDLNVFNTGDNSICELQITSLSCSSFTKPQPKNDRKIFSKTVWRPDVSSGISAEEAPVPKADMFEVIDILDRVSVYYLRRLCEKVSQEEVDAAEWHFQSLMHWARDYLLPKIDSGRHRRLKASSSADTPEMVNAWVEKYGHIVDMEIVHAVGEGLPAMVRGQLPTLQVLMENNRLNRLYKEGVGIDWAYAQFRLLVEQISHRHPRLRVLEIGAGTGGASVTAIKAVSPHFASYTYTDISPAFFDKAKALFTADELAKMDFKVLDIERDPIEQGFEEHSFDLVLASNVLHATKFLSKTLANCRRLTKPGGRMVLIEVTGNAIFTSFSMSGLPGWWLGKDDGRVYGPLVSEARWDMLMQDAGFSGVDVSGGELDDYYCLVMSTQAVDDRVELLRDPLSIATWDKPVNAAAMAQIKDIVIVGGKTVAVCRSTQIIRRLLRPLQANIVLVPGVEDFVDHPIPTGAAILCLADLDEPMFKNMTEVKFRGMQNMILESGGLLWVTKNRRTAEPYSNMAVGMARAIAFESPHLFLQFLDLDHFHGGLGSQATAEATILAETFLRLVYLGDPSFGDLLWTREQELSIQDGRLFIPRIMHNEELNDRLNADRRRITRDIELNDASSGVTGTAVEIVQEANHLQVLESDPFAPLMGLSPENREYHRVKITTSSLFPLVSRNNKIYFLGAGNDLDDGQKEVLFLSSENRSVVHISPESILPLSAYSGEKAELLQGLLLDIFVESLTYEVEGALWVHGGDDNLVARLAEKAVEKSIHLITTTSRSDLQETQVFVHPFDTEEKILGILPRGPVAFTNLSSVSEMEVLDRVLRHHRESSTGSSIEVKQVFKSVHNQKAVSLNISSAELDAILRRYVSDAQKVSGVGSLDVLRIEEVSDLPVESLSPVQIVTWAATSPVPALLFPTTSLKLFNSDKTYFLVGLTGALGLSLCGWMADKGARHIAVASRNPQIDPVILEDLKRRGATDVRIFVLDVSDKEALRAVHAQICAEMPPIAGVANAAMVLHDKPFDNYTVDEFTCTFGPKVDGSRYLDELFSKPGELDFFVLFSSLSCVIGNKAQSNYSAANMYMHTLANQRHQRGLPAAVMDIAMLLGVGYVDRALEQFESRLVGLYGYIGLSEPEMHNIFASAILAGHPGSSTGKQGPEIITGLPLDAGTRFPTKPLFSHIAQEEEETSAEAQDDNTEPSARVLGQLATAAGQSEAMLAILERAFSRKVELILQLPSEKIETKVPLIKLGIDSLVAVELRSWFLKELAIDMAVLKFLGGSSILDLCKDALGQLSASSSAAAAAKTPNSTADDKPPKSPSLRTTAETPSTPVTPSSPASLSSTSSSGTPRSEDTSSLSP